MKWKVRILLSSTNHCIPVIVDLFGALFEVTLTQCGEGARDVKIFGMHSLC